MSLSEGKYAKVIPPFLFGGKLQVNASKSYFQRAMAIALLASGKSILNQINWSNDTKAVHALIKQLGAKTFESNHQLEINSPTSLVKANQLVNVGESGLALRMFAGILSHYGCTIRIDGHGSLRSRPIFPIMDTLHQAGVKVESTNGSLPLSIQGPMKGGEISIDGSFSSQILSGLLIALPLLEVDTTLHVHRATSTPYIDMTLDIMSHFGVEVSHDQHEYFHIQGRQHYTGMAYTVEGDWSGAANHVVGAAMSGEITLHGLNPNSKQADRTILDVLDLYGASVLIENGTIQIQKKESRPFTFDATHSPDLFPPIVCLAASCVGDSIIKGTDRLLHKESNRLEALVTTFTQLGVRTSTRPNELIVHGSGKVKSGTIDSFNDHRIAMAATICATIADGPIHINGAEAVAKSYPGFFDDIESISKGK